VYSWASVAKYSWISKSAHVPRYLHIRAFPSDMKRQEDIFVPLLQFVANIRDGTCLSRAVTL